MFYSHYFHDGCFYLYLFKINPALKEEMANATRLELLKSGNKTPQEIDTMVINAKNILLQCSYQWLYLDTCLLVHVVAALIDCCISLSRQKTINMDLTIVIPLLNEEESLPELAAWIERVMLANNYSYEVIMIDDGSTDNSWKVIEGLRTRNNNIKGIKFQRNYGKSAALNEGFKAAQGEVIITMDADMQDSPDEIPGSS